MDGGGNTFTVCAMALDVIAATTLFVLLFPLPLFTTIDAVCKSEREVAAATAATVDGEDVCTGLLMLGWLPPS